MWRWRAYGLLSRSGRRFAACLPSKGRRHVAEGSRPKLCRTAPWPLLSSARARRRPQTSCNYRRLKKLPQPQANDVAYSPSQPSSESTNASETKRKNGDECSEEPSRKKWKMAEERRDSEEEDKEVAETPNETGDQHEARTGPKIIYVSNLPLTVRDKHVREFFDESGSIDDISFFPHSNTYCYGFVTFSEVEGAQRALVMNDRPLMGRKIKVKENLNKVKTLLAVGDTSR